MKKLFSTRYTITLKFKIIFCTVIHGQLSIDYSTIVPKFTCGQTWTVNDEYLNVFLLEKYCLPILFHYDSSLRNGLNNHVWGRTQKISCKVHVVQ